MLTAAHLLANASIVSSCVGCTAELIRSVALEAW